MAAVFCDEGITWMAQSMHGDTTNGRAPLYGGLYTAISPALSATSVKANITEMSGLGYTRVTLTGIGWKFNLDTTNHVATGSYILGFQFTAGAAQTVIGWYLADNSNTRLMIAETLATAITNIGTTRLTVSITVNITLKLCS
jgi:hypothetical protein